MNISEIKQFSFIRPLGWYWLGISDVKYQNVKIRK